MATTEELREVIDNAECVDCGHMASDHVNHRAPCSGCWRDMVKICEQFIPSEETKAKLRVLGPIPQEAQP